MNIKSTEQLGRTIRTLRKQLKVTQAELAMTSGTGLRFIVDLEKGKATCQIGKILQVLQALGVQLQADRSSGTRGTP
jgi:HTH-type transcriptional regulator/antitoxin HipB